MYIVVYNHHTIIYKIKQSIVMLALVCQSLSWPVACLLLPDQEVTWLVLRSVGRQAVGRSGQLNNRTVGPVGRLVSRSASQFGVAVVGWSAGLFGVAANKPDRLTRVGRSLGSPYLYHTALQAPTPRLVGLIGVV